MRTGGEGRQIDDCIVTVLLLLLSGVLEVWCHERDPDLSHAILVFLPTWRMLEQGHALLEQLQLNLACFALHSYIDIDECIESMEHAPDQQRKIVLATNMAESSITIVDTALFTRSECSAECAGRTSWQW